MNRLLSSIGVGAATVDTLLPERDFIPGETVEATIELEGGRSDQEIDALYFALLTQVGNTDHVIDQFEITDSVSLPAGETLTMTSEVTIPRWTPLTRADHRVWLKTGLDVSWAVDPNDEDDIEVAPSPIMDALFQAVDDLGFEAHGSELREPDWLDDRPFAQAFEFGPGPDAYRDDIEELTLVFLPREDDLRTVIEIDEREPSEAETAVAFDRQEVFHTFGTSNENMVRRQLQTTIDSHTHTE